MNILNFKALHKEVDFSDLIYSGRMDAEYFSNLKDDKFRFVKLVSLCELIETGPAGSVLGAKLYKQKGIKVIRPSNLNGWTCESGKRVFVDRKITIKGKVRVYNKDDILIGRIGDFKCGIIRSEKCVISPNLLAVRVNKNLCDAYFLMAYLNSENAHMQIDRLRKKTSLSSINIRNISKLEIPVVSYAEQFQIGKRVRKAMKLIHKSQDLYKTACDLLSKKISSELSGSGEKSNIHSISNVKKFKRMDAEFFADEELNISGNVIKVPLGEIAEITSGVEPGQDEYANTGRVFLRGSNVSKYGLIGKSQKYLPEKIYKKFINKFQPDTGEILFVKDGKIGTSCVVINKNAGIISSGIVRIRVKSKIDPFYISLCLNSEQTVKEILKNSEGSLVPHLKLQFIKKISIPLVDEALRNEISELVRDSHLKFDQAFGILKKAVKETSGTNQLKR